MKVMQAFRRHHKWLGTDEQNKMFWAIKRATDSDEVAYAYFNYYSGITGQRIVKADGTKLEEMKKNGRVGDTKPGDDSYFDPAVFAPGYNDADLGALLLHEFGHTGHKTYGDYQEGQTYGVQYFYAEHAGGSPDMLRIRGLISTWPGSDGLAIKSLFKITYAVMTELQKLKTTGTSTLPPLSGLNADDGKTLMATLITNFGALNETPPSGPSRHCGHTFGTTLRRSPYRLSEPLQRDPSLHATRRDGSAITHTRRPTRAVACNCSCHLSPL